MSDSPNFDFGKFVPGFDLLQNLTTSAVKGASTAIPQLPGMGSWVAPTLSVEELDKRIDELKAVQFWLDQNAMALKATIQALEVQKMTLATLKGMNFNMGELANAFKFKAVEPAASTVHKAAEKVVEKAADVSAPVAAPAAPNAVGQQPEAAATSASAPVAGVIDPVQWWGSLTQQFQNIAAAAMKEGDKQAPFDATQNIATDIAKEALKLAASLTQVATESVAKNSMKTKATGDKSMKNAVKVAVKKVAKKTATKTVRLSS